jgi:hypothetical protein
MLAESGMDLRIPIASRLIEHDSEASDEQFLATAVRQPTDPRRDHARLDATQTAWFACGVEGRSDAADDGAHHFHQGGEEQFLGVLFVGGGGEALVEWLGGEAVFEGGAEHDADGAGGGEAFEDGVEEHPGHLPERSRSPRKGIG